MGTPIYRLVSTRTFPPTDDQVVGALLAFCNGDPITFATGQGVGVETLVSCAFGQPFRQRCTSHLTDLLTRGQADLGVLFEMSAELLPELSKCTHSALAITTTYVKVGKKKTRKKEPPEEQFAQMDANELRDWGREEMQGIRIIEKRCFPSFEVAMNYALMLMLDLSKPYGGLISRCQLESCGRFYIAQKNPKGGPPNRHYCTPNHRQDAHDSKANRGKRR